LLTAHLPRLLPASARPWDRLRRPFAYERDWRLWYGHRRVVIGPKWSKDMLMRSGRIRRCSLCEERVAGVGPGLSHTGVEDAADAADRAARAEFSYRALTSRVLISRAPGLHKRPSRGSKWWTMTGTLPRGDDLLCRQGAGCRDSVGPSRTLHQSMHRRICITLAVSLGTSEHSLNIVVHDPLRRPAEEQTPRARYGRDPLAIGLEKAEDIIRDLAFSLDQTQ